MAQRLYSHNNFPSDSTHEKIDYLICKFRDVQKLFIYYHNKLDFMQYKTQNVVILSGILLIAVFTTTMYQTQSLYGFSWPCIDRSDGKAPIAISGDNVYVAWWGNSSGNYEVMFKASADGGQTFGDKISLSNSTNGTSVEADIAAVDDNVYVTFADNKTGTADAYIMTSNDNGKTFNPAIKLTDNSDSKLANKTYMSELNSYNVKTSPYELQVAAEGDNVYVLATGGEKNSTTYQPDVFVKVSNDSGKTFGKDINLSQSPGNKSDRIQIEAMDGKVYVTWWDKKMDGTDEPLMRISNDGGQTFGDKKILSANTTQFNNSDDDNNTASISTPS